MSKRVILGNLGTSGSSTLYGLRVSKEGQDAINTDGTVVDVTNLLFDSVNPIGHLPIYKIYDVTVNAATLIAGTSSKVVTPTTKTVSFGETLTYVPIAEAYEKTTTNDFKLLQRVDHSYRSNYDYSRSVAPADQGFVVTAYDNEITVSNFYQSQKVFRVFLFQPPGASGTGNDVTPNTVDWTDISVSGSSGVGETNSQTISGIDTSITLRVSTGGTSVPQIEAYNGTTQLATASNASSLDVTVNNNTPVKWRFTNPGVNSSFTATVTNVTEANAFVDSFGVSINSLAAYNLSGPPLITEGATGTFNISTSNVATGTTIYWYIVNGTTADFNAVSGSETLDANGDASFTITPKEDNTIETDENYTVRISLTNQGTAVDSVSVTIRDAAPTYTITTAPTSITEGTSGTFTVTTNNVSNGTNLFFTIDGNPTAEFSSTTGSFSISSNSGQFTLSPSEDSTIEQPAESYTVRVRTGSLTGTIVASATFSVVDAAPTYAVSGATSMNEGQTKTYTVTTNNVADGTTLYWGINATTADFNSTGGPITISNNSAQFDITAKADLTTEGNESFTISIVSLGGTTLATTGFVVVDTSLTPESGTLTPATANFTEGGTGGTFTATISDAQSSSFNWQITRNSGTTGSGEITSDTSGTFTAAQSPYDITLTVTNDSTSEINYQGESFTLTLRAGGTVGSGTVLDTSTFVIYDDDTTVAVSNVTIPNGTTYHDVTFSVTMADTGTVGGRIKDANGTIVKTNLLITNGSNTVTVPDAPANGTTEAYSIELYNGIAWLSAASYNVTTLGTPTYALTPVSGGVLEGDDEVFTFATTNTIPGQDTYYWRVIGNPDNPIGRVSPLSGSFTTSGNTGSNSNQFTITAATSSTVDGTRSFKVQVYADSNYQTLRDESTLTLNDANPTFSITAPSIIAEGGSGTVDIDTTNVPNSTTLFWTIDNATTSEFVAVSGSATVFGNYSNFNIQPKENNTIESNRTYTVRLRTGSTSGITVATDTFQVQDAPPSYSIAANNIYEGTTATITATTNNVAAGTVLYWTINGTTADFVAISGTINVTAGGVSYSTMTAKEDSTIEVSESFTISLRTGSTSGPVVASDTFAVIDQPASYSISGPGNMNEGATATVYVGTNNVASGTTLFWTINSTTADFNAVSGQFSIDASGNGSFDITTKADNTTEGNQTFTVYIRTGSTSGPVVASSGFTVIDTSLTPDTGTISVANVTEGGSITVNIGVTAYIATEWHYRIVRVTGNSPDGIIPSYATVYPANGNQTFSVALGDDTTSEINYQGEQFTAELRTGPNPGVGNTSGTLLASTSFKVYDDDTTVSATNLTIPNTSTAHTASITVSYVETGSAPGRIKNGAGTVVTNFTASSGTNSVFVNDSTIAGTTETYTVELNNGNTWLSGTTYTVTRLGTPTYSLSNVDNITEGGSGTYTFIKNNELQTTFYWRIEANPNNPIFDFPGTTGQGSFTATLGSSSNAQGSFSFSATDPDSTNTNSRGYIMKVYKNSNYTTLLASDAFNVTDNDSGGGGGGGECFIAGSQVLMADRTYKPIEEVQVGDKVIGLEEMINEVVDLRIHEEEQRVMCSLGTPHYFTTDSHPFLDSEGYWTAVNLSVAQEKYPNLPLRELVPGTTLMKYDVDLKAYVPHLVSYINQSVQNRKVYNLNVSGEDTPGIPGNDTYIVDGYIVHNK